MSNHRYAQCCKFLAVGTERTQSNGYEGDGNPLALGVRKTRFDPEVSDYQHYIRRKYGYRKEPC